MAFSMTNVLNSLVEATTRSPKAIKLTEEHVAYEQPQYHRPGMDEMMAAQPRVTAGAAGSDRSSEEMEHDTLARIRDALYSSQQS